ncbi:hypothetical protein TH61_03340 [Rufibacter sp. DG15C]|nr:hypothetical protein TH61_03340 [Rufibacter sp. DG15C]
MHLCEEKTVRAFSEFLFFLILLVTFLIKEKSDKPRQEVRIELVGKTVLGGRGSMNFISLSKHLSSLPSRGESALGIGS